uniref:Uncharacterized protein LOC123612213 n=1 Tax=Camelus bactrianus TaxID=9837 RepID=A0A9W3FIL6_CAMBA|nr:uncharacterized protein LOC123612213 [Camelus bactrianus]
MPLPLWPSFLSERGGGPGGRGQCETKDGYWSQLGDFSTSQEDRSWELSWELNSWGRTILEEAGEEPEITVECPRGGPHTRVPSRFQTPSSHQVIPAWPLTACRTRGLGEAGGAVVLGFLLTGLPARAAASAGAGPHGVGGGAWQSWEKLQGPVSGCESSQHVRTDVCGVAAAGQEPCLWDRLSSLSPSGRRRKALRLFTRLPIVSHSLAGQWVCGRIGFLGISASSCSVLEFTVERLALPAPPACQGFLAVILGKLRLLPIYGGELVGPWSNLASRVGEGAGARKQVLVSPQLLTCCGTPRHPALLWAQFSRPECGRWTGHPLGALLALICTSEREPSSALPISRLAPCVLQPLSLPQHGHLASQMVTALQIPIKGPVQPSRPHLVPSGESDWLSGVSVPTVAQSHGQVGGSHDPVARRYIAICHRMRAHTVCTLARAKRIMAGV